MAAGRKDVQQRRAGGHRVLARAVRRTCRRSRARTLRAPPPQIEFRCEVDCRSRLPSSGGPPSRARLPPQRRRILGSATFAILVLVLLLFLQPCEHPQTSRPSRNLFLNSLIPSTPTGVFAVRAVAASSIRSRSPPLPLAPSPSVRASGPSQTRVDPLANCSFPPRGAGDVLRCFRTRRANSPYQWYDDAVFVRRLPFV